MGVLNVTPDSFSDGGLHDTVPAALRHAQGMVLAGAAIIDVGGESTRPGARSVSIQQELDRVIPVIEAISSELDTVISIDTSKAAVMREAVSAGAGMINDVMALRGDGSLEAAAELNVPVCLMHMQGDPRTMQEQPHYRDVVAEVGAFLCARADAATAAGIDGSHVIIDPGFGFGKTLEHNLNLLRGLGELVATGYPVLIGVSRKSMIGGILGVGVDQRLTGSVALALIARQRGAQIIRAHDVQATVEALTVLDAVLGQPLADV